MNQIVTTGIILTRTDFGEADRILTVLTPDNGKLRLMAKGVRRLKSKLAGSIELFSVTNITFIRGRGDIGTLVSARLVRHFSTIVHDIDRTMLCYELMKQLNKVTEDEPDQEYYHLLEHTLEAMDDVQLSTEVISSWFRMQLLRIGGHSPNLHTDAKGQKLVPDQRYGFDLDSMAFVPLGQGRYRADHIKYLRIGFSAAQPRVLQQITGIDKLLKDTRELVEAMASQYAHV